MSIRPATPRSLVQPASAVDSGAAGVRELGKQYDEDYFLHRIGDMDEPYVRDNPAWKAIFARVAQAIATELSPKTVLDAGCGIGFLVQALRERDVDAFGIDISEYAIANAAEEVRPFCEVASVTDELTRRYDLIVCMEVLEHLPAQLASRAVDNFTRHTDAVLFSSTPEDFREPTHLNVQPTEYWVGLFGSRDFFRDVDFDASFVADHAILFRRISDLPNSVLRAYERRYWRTEKEVRELRTAAYDPASGRRLRGTDDGQHAERRFLEERLEAMKERHAELRRLLVEANEQLLRRDDELRIQRREQIRLRDEKIRWLGDMVHQRDQEIEWLRGLQSELDHIHATRAWRLVSGWWRLRARLRKLLRRV
jgi:2-polyprenyl-3-methyl-5-hydroxy-6-metoxy-1,4-benzoquinol methylase